MIVVEDTQPYSSKRDHDGSFTLQLLMLIKSWLWLVWYESRNLQKNCYTRKAITGQMVKVL